MKLVAFLILCGLSTVAVGQAAPAAFPLEKGTTWVYRAHVKAAQPDSSKILEKDLQWTMTVEDAIERGNTSAALLSGSPWDLAWYTPDLAPSEFLVVRMGATYYFVRERARERLAKIKAGADIDESAIADDIWFTTPLREGEAACPPGQRTSTPLSTPPLWCWSVERITNDDLPAEYRKQDSYQLVYRSNPDHVLLTVTPGVGITSWQYGHHGTTSEATLLLVKFEPGGRNRSPSVPSNR